MSSDPLSSQTKGESITPGLNAISILTPPNAPLVQNNLNIPSPDTNVPFVPSHNRTVSGKCNLGLMASSIDKPCALELAYNHLLQNCNKNTLKISSFQASSNTMSNLSSKLDQLSKGSVQTTLVKDTLVTSWVLGSSTRSNPQYKYTLELENEATKGSRTLGVVTTVIGTVDMDCGDIQAGMYRCKILNQKECIIQSDPIWIGSLLRLEAKLDSDLRSVTVNYFFEVGAPSRNDKIGYYDTSEDGKVIIETKSGLEQKGEWKVTPKLTGRDYAFAHLPASSQSIITLGIVDIPNNDLIDFTVVNGTHKICWTIRSAIITEADMIEFVNQYEEVVWSQSCGRTTETGSIVNKQLPRHPGSYYYRYCSYNFVKQHYRIVAVSNNKFEIEDRDTVSLDLIDGLLTMVWHIESRTLTPQSWIGLFRLEDKDNPRYVEQVAQWNMSSQVASVVSWTPTKGEGWYVAIAYETSSRESESRIKESNLLKYTPSKNFKY